MAVISVVMPAYNAEAYIAEAIQSVIHQTFTEWELVIVDDCSSDSTYEIASRYALADKRIRLYKLEYNTGNAYLPRKMAIEQAEADWIVNLDADDYIEPQDLEKLYNRALETAADIVLHRLVRVLEGNVTSDVCPAWDFDMEQLMDGDTACRLTLGKWVINGNGLFRKKLFLFVWQTGEESFVGMNTDELLTRQLFLCADRVALCDASYFYRLNPLSVSNRFSLKLFQILRTDRQLKNIIASRFGADSEERILMELQCWKGVLRCGISYVSKIKQIPGMERKRIKQEIRCAWNELDWKKLKLHVGYWQYQLFSRTFGLFMFIITVWKYVSIFKRL